ncbi:MAG: hypothetical protein ABEI99_07530, partial [Halobaculum sp.]
MSGVTSEPAHLGVWVAAGFGATADGLASELDSRLDRTVTVTDAGSDPESYGGLVLFCDDPDTVEQRLHQAESPPVVSTTNPAVARVVRRN